MMNCVPITTRDIPILITSTASSFTSSSAPTTTSSERRITPSWTLAQLKTKLEPITGIAPSNQRLILRLPDQDGEIPLEASDEDTKQVGSWRLVAYAEIKVLPIHPTSLPIPTLTSSTNADDAPAPSAAMDPSTYATLPNTVLAYKKTHQIGRFDPDAPTKLSAKVEGMWAQVRASALSPSKRCHLLHQPTRRGTIRSITPIPELPGPEGAPWIGVEMDEPWGRNDGSVPVPAATAAAAGAGDKDGGEGEGGGNIEGEGKGEGQGEGARKRYFQCSLNFGVFVRPERVVVGDFEMLAGVEGEDGDDMEEI